MTAILAISTASSRWVSHRPYFAGRTDDRLAALLIFGGFRLHQPFLGEQQPCALLDGLAANAARALHS